MKTTFQQIRLRWFPPVSRRRALRIARKACGHDLAFHTILGDKPGNINVYHLPAEPCWFILSPWNDGKDGTMLRSSRLLLVSKLSGRILYDGSAEDEG